MRALVLAVLLAGAARADVTLPRARVERARSERVARAWSEMVVARKNLLRMRELSFCLPRREVQQAEEALARAQREYDRALRAL